MVMEAVAQSWTSQRERIRDSTARIREQLGAVGRIEPAEATPGPELLEGAVAAAAGARRPRARRLRPGAEVPARLGARAAARPRGARRGRGHARRDGRGRHPRPGRRRLRPLLGRRRLARAPLREDALRQRAPRARLPARLPGARPRALARHLRAHARLDAGRDARPRGRLLLGARRRLRGRRGALLRLDAGRDPHDARRVRARVRGRADARPLRRHRARQLRGREHPPSRSGRDGARAGGGSSACAGRSTKRGRSASGPGSTTSGSASWNALAIAALADAGAVLGRAGLPRRGARLRRVRLGADARRRRPSAAHLQGRRGEAERLPRGPRLPGRGAADALRGDLRAALVRARPRDRRRR